MAGGGAIVEAEADSARRRLASVECGESDAERRDRLPFGGRILFAPRRRSMPFHCSSP